MVPSAPLGPIEIRIQNGRAKVFRPDLDANQPMGELVFDLMLKGREAPLPFEAVRLEIEENGFGLQLELWDVVSLNIHLEYRSEMNGVGMRFRLVNPTEDMTCRLTVGLRRLVGDAPRWMIPGIFYKHNRPEKCHRVYPAFVKEGLDATRMLSNAWSFRSDRAATPCVFAWTSKVGAYMLTEERIGITDSNRHGLGMTGLYLRADRGDNEIGVLIPYAETPIRYAYCTPERTAPDESWMEIPLNQVVDWEGFFGVGAPVTHSYDSILRAESRRAAPGNPIRPWMEGEEAENLALHGLLSWHCNPVKRAIYDTAVFDKHFGQLGAYVDRPAMHAGWNGGAPVAYAMLMRGREDANAPLVETAQAVLSHIAEARTALGTFWPEWEEGIGWTTGLNPMESWIHARTLAECSLFMVRALRLEIQYGFPHPIWLQAIQSTLDFALRIQREDGCFGTCYDVETGEVGEWEGCAGMAWIGALVAGSALLYDPRYREGARKAGAYYARFIEDEFLYGSAEDQFLTPTVEDGYCALTSYLLLYELDRGERWLRLARRAAEWALSFRFTYNVTFPKHTMLGTYEYRTRGADGNSPANHALHTHTLWSYPDMLKLSNLTEDPYYRARAEEQRLSCHQFLAREDGDFGARKGMMPGQLFQTDWWQPKGCLLTLSNASALGGLLYANLLARVAHGPPRPKPKAKEQAPGTTKSDAAGTPPAPGTAPGEAQTKPEKPIEELEAGLDPLDRSWAASDPRETREIPIKWKIF